MRSVRCSDLRGRLPAALREVERQGGITITRRAVPVARIVPPDGFIHRGPEPSEETRRVVSQIRAARLDGPRLSIDEILSARDEGRR